MKKFLLLTAISISFISTAQNLESKIPNTAKAVVSIDGDRLAELVSIAEFDKYSFAQQMFKQMGRHDSTSVIKSITDIGFDVKSKAYYFYQSTDSVSYNNILFKLNDKNKFESLLSKRNKENLVKQGDFNITTDYNSVTVWNDNMLILCMVQDSYRYFKDNEERFMKQAENEDERFYQVKKRITKEWAKNQALSIFNNSEANSVLKNKSYLASKDKKAAASAWVNNYGEIMSGAMSSIYGMANMGSMLSASTPIYEGFESVVANLYFEEDAARMTMEMEVSGEWQKTLKKIYKSKLDKKFFNYFNQNDALAYMSFSTDMQAVFEEYPTLMANMYSGVLPNMKEEMELGGEFLSLLLDEEAIGELMTGDMLFVLNDFAEKDVEYTDYEYDEDYNRKEIKKTKKETIPDFTIMIGSKKGSLLNKVARLGVKHKLFESKAGYYRIDVPKRELPVDLYTVVKDDILFFSTSEDKIANITRGAFTKNQGKHEKLMRNNVSAIYFNGQQIMSKVPLSELRTKEKGYLDFAKANLTDAYFTSSSKMKGNKMVSEMKVNTSGSQKNSLKLIFDFIEVLAN